VFRLFRIFRGQILFQLMRKATWIDIFSLLFNYSQRYRVEGDSMLPTLKHGEEVVVQPTETFQIGDIVVANHPYKQSVTIIKRISEINEKGLFLRGDNPSESTDSRSFGEVSVKNVLGKVVCKLN
jgi:nickel-type superoxide dismutase maturation protease